jgi:hypothetical protein
MTLYLANTNLIVIIENNGCLELLGFFKYDYFTCKFAQINSIIRIENCKKTVEIWRNNKNQLCN